VNKIFLRFHLKTFNETNKNLKSEKDWARIRGKIIAIDASENARYTNLMRTESIT